MNKLRSLVGMLIIGVVPLTVFAMGHNLNQTEKELRDEADKQGAEAKRMDAAGNALREVSDPANGDRAKANTEKAAKENIVSAAEGAKQLANNKPVEAAKTADNMAENLGITHAGELEATEHMTSDKIQKDLAEARDRAAKARETEKNLTISANAVKAAAAKPAQAKPAAPAAPAGGAHEHGSAIDRANGNIGGGHPREFHGNDRAAEKAGRTG